MRGIVWDGQRLIVTDALDVRAPGPGEVRVRVLASGICHSDLHVMEHMPEAAPIVLGHEAAGVVAELGEGVDGLRVGDAVMVATQTPCGHCRACARDRHTDCAENWGTSGQKPFLWEGRPTASFAQCSSFAGEIVVKASQLFPTGDIPAAEAALLGCAVSTGYYGARWLGEVSAGDVVAVFGVGGIGVNALQAVKLAGAALVIAVDVNAAKAETAKRFGADRCVIVGTGDSGAGIVAKLQATAGAPIDVTIECSGATPAIEAAIEGPRRGGTCVLIGMTAPGRRASFDIGAVVAGRRIVAAMNGATLPARDYPPLIDLAKRGAIDLAGQVTQIWPLGEVEDAIAALRAGRVTRAVLDHRT